MRWFGKHWGAPVCDSAPRAECPTTTDCVRCGTRLLASSDGLLIPHFKYAPSTGQQTIERAYHLNCFLKTVGVDG